MAPVRRALIVGGGIAGPATALALHRAGFDPLVLEAHSDAADSVGAFLTLASNGIDALRVLDADRAALAGGFPTPLITLRSGTGKRLGDTRTGLTPPDAPTSVTVRRADLYRALHRLAIERGIPVEHGRRLVAAHITPDGVRAVFADGSDVVGDVLVGCDGVHSTVRRLIDARAPAPTYSGLLTCGGYTRDVVVPAPTGTYEMIFGRSAFFGYAPAPDGQVWWFANLPHAGEPAPSDLAAVDPAYWRDRLVEAFAADAGPAVELIRATAEPISMSAVHTLPHLPHWYRGAMVVIGDAAHAPSPTSGQGASLAIEDAVTLAVCLRDLPDPTSAFARFEILRRPRVEQIIRWAQRINNSKAAGPVGRRIRDALLPTVLRLNAANAMQRRLFTHHIDWDASAKPEELTSSGPRHSSWLRRGTSGSLGGDS
jgi:FAD-dependent urate hydroxylase